MICSVIKIQIEIQAEIEKKINLCMTYKKCLKNMINYALSSTNIIKLKVNQSFYCLFLLIWHSKFDLFRFLLKLYILLITIM